MEKNTYLFLGQNVAVPKKNVIAVFDLDNSSTSRITREFLAAAEKAGEVSDVSGELPKSFVLTVSDGRRTCYLSQLNSYTLLKRWESPLLDVNMP
jgi:hypothetical protein